MCVSILKLNLHFSACLCNLAGTEDDGLCESSNFDMNITAGQCHCKKNVIGLKCDECKSGFWNLDESNPDGCERK